MLTSGLFNYKTILLKEFHSQNCFFIVFFFCFSDVNAVVYTEQTVIKKAIFYLGKDADSDCIVGTKGTFINSTQMLILYI